MTDNRGKDNDVELHRLNQYQRQTSTSSRQHWQQVFNQIDSNRDGHISYGELKDSISHGNTNIPKSVARKLLKDNDINSDGVLDFEEFHEMVQEPETRALFQNGLQRYVHTLVPNPAGRVRAADSLDGEYEEEYSCCPPPIAMIIISLVEIIAYVLDASIKDNSFTHSEPVKTLIYDPHRRYQAWRFLTYMFVHNGIFHLLVNLLVQIMLGIPLEMVHGWWRVSIVYLVGVVAGSLGTSVSDPAVYLAGASGGVYAIMTAHVATIIMNWKEMQFAIAQLCIFLVIASVDIGTAIYNRYFIDSMASQTIGYAAHLAGAIAGLLVGINVLRNLKVNSWEKKLWWVALSLFSVLTLAAIIWNAAFPSYFPQQYY